MKRRQHLEPPVVVLSDGGLLAPTGTNVGTAAAPVVAVQLEHLLGEPPPRTPTWVSSVFGRLCVASRGPVLVAGQGPCSERLERARWLRVAPDADWAAARAAAWPALPMLRELRVGVGSCAPDLVVVAERDPHDRLPLFGRSGIWLFRALRMLGHDELTVYVANALDKDGASQGTRLGVLRDTFGPYGPTWLACGAVASEALTHQGIEHAQVQHPAWHRRYRFHEGPEGFATLLRKAGVPEGAWASELARATGGLVPPAVLVSGERGYQHHPLLEHLDVPLSIGLERVRGGGSATHRLLEARARTAYVTGTFRDAGGQVHEVRTLEALAAAMGANARVIRQAATRGDWEAERAKHLSEVHERAKASAVEVEARRVSQARDLSWALAVTMGGRLLEAVKDKRAKLSAREFKAIVDAAVTLSEKGDVHLEDARAKVQALSPQDLLKNFRAAMVSLGLEEDVAPVAAPVAGGGGASDGGRAPDGAAPGGAP